MCEVGWAQLARLHGGHGLELEEVLTVRNVFHFCLLDLSSNGWWPIGDRNGANTQSVLPAEFVWPHRAIDELRLILVGKRVEPRNYFYTFCKLKPRSWSSKSTGIQEGSTSTPINIVGADESWWGVYAINRINKSIERDWHIHECTVIHVECAKCSI